MPKRLPRMLLLGVLALLNLPSEGFAAEPRFAVLVGVGTYHPESVAEGITPASGGGLNLKSPPNDVALMNDVLSRYGFDSRNTVTLKDADATRDRITAAVRDNLLTLKAGSLAVFYYSGHGSALRGSDAGGEWIDETITTGVSQASRHAILSTTKSTAGSRR